MRFIIYGLTLFLASALPLFAHAHCSNSKPPYSGRVRVVTIGEDYKIKKVNIGENFIVKFVRHAPTRCGEWQLVTVGEDFKVRFVNIGEDFKIKLLSH